MTPAITVVLPTFRRPDALTRLLGSLAGQADPGGPWDLVVVDNDDRPGAEVTLEPMRPSLPPVLLVREPRRGAAHARNAGIAAARGEIIAFVDDDVVPGPEWLRNLVAPIVAGRCEGTGGRVQLDPTTRLPPWLGEGWTGYLSDYDRGDEERELGTDDYVLTACAAFRTDLVRDVGGFDPVLGPRPNVPMVNDDIDLCRRVRAGGGRIRYVPGARVVHELPAERLTRGYLLRRTYAQGRSDWLLDRDENGSRPLGGARGIPEDGDP